MTRVTILTLLALALVVMACPLQTIPPSSVAPASTDTPLPPNPSDTPTPTATSHLTLDILRNGTYFAPFYGKTITLVDGAFSGADSYSVRMLDKVAFGDLNGDGAGDAAILLVENGGGSGGFESVIAVLDSGGAPSQAGQHQLGDRVKINALAIASGTLTIDMLVQGPNDAMCCPTLPETQSYRMIDNSLWMTRLTSLTPDKRERSITITSHVDNENVNTPFTVSGSVTIAPFENNLVYRLYLPDGTMVTESPLVVYSKGVAGGPGTFFENISLENAGITGPVIIQFLNLSAADGTTQALASVMLVVH